MDSRLSTAQLARLAGPFAPPTVEGSIQYPINMGGANWGSVSIDPVRGRLYVNMTRIAGGIEMIPRAVYDTLECKESGWPYPLMPMHGAPYAVSLAPLLSPLGAPCSPPPCDSLTAIDLASGSVLWESSLGNSRDRAPFPIRMIPGIRDLGSPNLGGLSRPQADLFSSKAERMAACTHSTRRTERSFGVTIWPVP